MSDLTGALYELEELAELVARESGADASVTLHVSRQAFDLIAAETAGDVLNKPHFAAAGDGSPVKRLQMFDGRVTVECQAIMRHRTAKGRKFAGFDLY